MQKSKNKEYIKEINKSYFGLSCRIYTTSNSEKYYPDFPWNFEIEYNGKLLSFGGIPNMVESPQKAMKRAWYRAKWLVDGSYNSRYK